MAHRLCFSWTQALLALSMVGTAHAIESCELGGQPVNPNNGAATAGKTGLMRCRDGDSGVVLREQELQNGKPMGVARYFKNGQVEREFNVDERGNRSGLSREWRIEPGGQRALVHEETDRDSRAVGIVRSWYPGGQLHRLSFHGDDGREQASVDFNADGRLADLRCAERPLFGADFDDRRACGHAGGVSTVALYSSKGVATTRVVFERGERRKVESLWESGAVRELRETTADGLLERSFAADGSPLREVRSLRLPAGEAATSEAQRRTIKVLDREFHGSGQLVHETRWALNDRGKAEVASENRWYLNGQPKERIEYAQVDSRRTRRETLYHDNGRAAFEGTWVVGRAGSGDDRSEAPTGTHKSFDEQGRLRSERIHDERGRLEREREFDASGAVIRDDAVFEDGSRKSPAR